MGLASSSPPPLSEEEKQRRKEQAKIDSQRENIFKEMLLELYKLKSNTPNTLAVEKEKCGRATYVKNYSSTYYCPKCGAGVQQFIENKLVKILNCGNQIYPLYSNNHCLTYENEKEKYSKFKIQNGVSIGIKQEENGDSYISIKGNKYYLTSEAKVLYNFRKNENDKNPFFFLEIIIGNNIAIKYKLNEEFKEVFHSKWGYDYYYYENPLRNYGSEKVIKYYRCVKCHLEYHLYTPDISYYLNFLKLKEVEENKEEVEKKEKENNEIKNE